MGENDNKTKKKRTEICCYSSKCKNVPSKMFSVIIRVSYLYIYFSVLLAERYGTEPKKLDMFQRCLSARKGEIKVWEELLEWTVIRILQRRSALSLEFLHYSVCHFSCDVVVTTEDKPGAHRSTSTALSLSRHLCQETPGLRDSKAHSLGVFHLLVCVATDYGHNLSLSLLPAVTSKYPVCPEGVKQGVKLLFFFFSMPDKLLCVHPTVPRAPIFSTCLSPAILVHTSIYQFNKYLYTSIKSNMSKLYKRHK